LTGTVLVVLGAFAPWALVRLLPLAEIASGAAGQLRGGLSSARGTVMAADEGASRLENWGGAGSGGMRRQVGTVSGGAFGRGGGTERGRAEIEKLSLPAGDDQGERVVDEPDPMPAPEPELGGAAANVEPEEPGRDAGGAPDPLIDSLASKDEWPA